MSLVYLGLTAFSAYAGTTSALWAAQRRLIFGKPTRIRPLPCGPLADRHAVRELRLQVADGVTLQGWCATPRPGKPRKVLLYFGGRNENVGWVPAMSTYVGPWALYAFNYRGFGQSGGKASEANAKADALAIYDEVVRLEGSGVTTIAVIGRSLGTSMAIALAARRAVNHLVLLSPFDSIEGLLRNQPVLRSMRWALNQKFDCRSDADQVTANTVMLLAGQDSRVPHRNSHAIMARFRNTAPAGIVQGTNHKTLPRNPETQTRIAAYLNA